MLITKAGLFRIIISMEVTCSSRYTKTSKYDAQYAVQVIHCNLNSLTIQLRKQHRGAARPCIASGTVQM